jgi:hypothetical protein
MSFESIDPSIQRDMAGQNLDVAKRLDVVGTEGLQQSSDRGLPGEPVDIKEIAEISRLSTLEMFRYVGCEIRVPDVADSIDRSGTVWPLLQNGYDKLARANLEPELIIAPEGRALDFWKNTFRHLRQNQNIDYPDAVNLLQVNSDQGIDGLDIQSSIVHQWEDIVDASRPRWSITVLPGILSSPYKYVNQLGQDQDRSDHEDLAKLVSNEPAFGYRYHAQSGLIDNPSTETALVLQALRVKSNKQLLDDGGFWLKENFMYDRKSSPRVRACFAKWTDVLGAVSIYSHPADDAAADLSVRPAVRFEV